MLRLTFALIFCIWSGAACVGRIESDSPASGAPVASATPGDASSGDSSGDASLPSEPPVSLPAAVVGHWYVSRGGDRVTLVFADGQSPSADEGSRLEKGDDAPAPLEHVAMTADGALSFGVNESAGMTWYRVTIRDGILAGRYAVQDDPPTDPAAYSGRLIGWRDETFSADVVPRVWDVSLDDHHRGILRIDRAAPGSPQLLGTLKPYATDGRLDEQASEDLDVQRWDGVTLAFVRPALAEPTSFEGTASGRTLAGTVTSGDGSTASWGGTRIEVLTHGIGARTAGDVTDWQSRTRARLGLLALGGNPPPLSSIVTVGPTEAPIVDDACEPNRDDDGPEWPQTYQLQELSFDSTIADPNGGAPLPRHAHGWVATPETPPPAEGYSVVLALNGHDGSARDVFDGKSAYWYGDSFARRGFLVVAVDVGHRPLGDRASLYTNQTGGDDAATGNGTHPAIEAPGLSSDWEEDGERTWDAMRALDYALGRPDVNRRDVSAVGLSMGGEVTDWLAAMDPRVQIAFSASSPTDLTILRLHGNHACWSWQRGDVAEYLDPGDLAALAAPRVLVRETGKRDPTYSDLATPFETAKEVVRRARPAFDALGGRLIHYLHFDAHAFHVGQYCALEAAFDGVTTPVDEAPSPKDLWSTSWLADGGTVELLPSIFALMPAGASN
ncbi:MAG TPA: hypothetical protein VIU64_19755 [Polyangia bacterium]